MANDPNRPDVRSPLSVLDPRRFVTSLTRRAAASRRADALFKTMATDFLLREQFVTEPTQILSEYLRGRKVDDDQAEVSDQLVYAVMSNAKLITWLRDYGVANKGELPAREKFVSDFSRAVVQSDAHHVVIALARAAAEGHDVLGIENGPIATLVELLGAGGIRATTEMTTGHSTGTMVSTAHRVASTEMTTGHSTGTMVSTAHRVANTDMSTGHSTGTDMSTGHIVFGPDFFGRGVLHVTLNALFEHATLLRDRGALDVVWAR